MRLLICADNLLLLDALTIALHDSGEDVVATALDPSEAVAAARANQPDVCLLDVNFPNGGGLSAVDRIHEASPETKLVILSGSISRALAAAAIAGATQRPLAPEEPRNPVGQLMRLAAQRHLVDQRHLADERHLADQGHQAADVLILQARLQPALPNGGPLSVLKFLTEREWEVLRCIMYGLSTEDMALRMGVHLSTARTHVQNLLGKFGVHSRLQVAALMTAHATHQAWSRIGIEVVETHADDERVAEAVRLGVRDWVVKQDAHEALLAAVREAHCSEAHLSAALLTQDLASLSGRGTSLTAEVETVGLLTARELDVLRCLSRGLSGNQTGALLFISPNTVRTHRRSILHKLNVHSTLTAVAVARAAGISGLQIEGVERVGDPPA